MAPRQLTKYGKLDSLEFARGPTEKANFAFERDSPTATVPGSRIITIPPYSTWSTGLHWHERYVESVRVLKGTAHVTIAGKTAEYGPEDGIVTFPRFTIHGFGRADGGNSAPDAEDTVLEEWVDPEDGFKVVFFYNILGALQECGGKPKLSDFLQLGTTLAYLDEYPCFVPGPFWLRRWITHAIFACFGILGRLLGYKPWLREYTPEDLWEVASKGGYLASRGFRQDDKIK